MLCLKGCRLGINKVMDGKRYKMALDSMKRRGLKRGSATEYEKKFTIDYVSMCVLLLSISEKSRPVTIVDILRRQKVTVFLRYGILAKGIDAKVRPWVVRLCGVANVFDVYDRRRKC
jgi:hypothetical protein